MYECKNSMLDLQNYFVSFKITYEVMVMNLNRKMIWSKLVVPSTQKYIMHSSFEMKLLICFILVIANAFLLNKMSKALSLKIHAYDTAANRMKMFSLCGILSWFW